MTALYALALIGAEVLALLAGVLVGWKYRELQYEQAREDAAAEADAWQASTRRLHAQLAAARHRRNQAVRHIRPMGVTDGR